MRKSSQPAENPALLEVLVVDDERLIRWSLRHGLGGRGHTVTEAESAAAAITVLTAEPNRFDVVVLDYRLPDRSDLTLLMDVRRLTPHSAVIMMTAYGDQAMRAEALSLGAVDVVDKPFQVKELVSLIESIGPR